MPGYIIYVDTWIIRLLANFAFEYLLLWATAEATRTPTSRLRLTAAAGLGTFHYLLYLLASLRLIPYFGLIRFFPVIILVSILMIITAFYPLTKSKLITVAAHFYGIGFASAGAGIGSAYLFGSPAAPQHTVGIFVAIASMLAIGELGWGIIQKRIYQHVYQIQLVVRWRGKAVRLTALVDTGNKLKDPFTQHPVIIAEYKKLTNLLPDEFAQIMAAVESGNLEPVASSALPVEVSSRFRVIPFHSIGRENGLLIGFRPDSVQILDHTPESEISLSNVIVGIHNRQLDPEGNYHALIPPEALQEALGTSPGRLSSLTEGGQSHATSAHSES